MVNRKVSLPLLTLVTITTLLFGLWPFNFLPENRVRWLAGQDGIQFYKPPGSSRRAHGGVVYSDRPLEVRTGAAALEPTTIEIYLESHGGKAGGLAHIASIHDGSPLSSLVIGLWKSDLIIRSRDNRNAGHNTYREIGLEDGLSANERRLITITSGPERTEIYVNGELARSCEIRSLIGVEHFAGYLSLGNSPIGHNAWTGNLYGLAIYDTLLTPGQIRRHYAIWGDGSINAPGSISTEPIVLYTFAERTGASVHDGMPGRNDLIMPPAFKALKRHVILQFWRYKLWNKAIVDDILINIVGFVPFALCMVAVLLANSRMSFKRAAFLTILAGVAVSLIIETSQLALPTRTPSSLDLLCNTTGAVLGVLVLRIVTRARATR